MGIRRSILEVLVSAMRAAHRFRAPKTPPSILVLRNNDLGDLVAITPLLQVLRMAFPDARIVVAVGRWSGDILKNNPYISEVMECNAPWNNHHTGAKKSLFRPLKYIYSSPEVSRMKAENFDIGIDVVGSPFGSMLFIHLGIPIRLGRKGYAGGHTGATAYLKMPTTPVSVAKNAMEFVLLLKKDANVDLDPKPQLFLDAGDVAEAEHVWREIQGSDGRRIPRIVVAPGAGLPFKQWPIERFAELAGRLAGESCGCVFGSAADFPLGEAIAAKAKGWSNRCGRFSLGQSMAIVSLADLIICNSTFALHLAWAFDKLCIVILPREIEPLGHAQSWEREGVHYQMSPRGDEKFVQVVEVENQARILLKRIQISQDAEPPLLLPEKPSR